MREMTRPGVWTDMGPAPAIRHRHRFETMGGTIVTAKITQVATYSPGELVREAARHQRVVDQRAARLALEGPVKLCGVMMRNNQVPCARRAGHAAGTGGGHRSREQMDLDLLPRKRVQS